MNAAKHGAPAGSLAAALVLLTFVGAYMLTGYLTLDEASRKVPILAGIVTVLLLGLEIFRTLARAGPDDAGDRGIPNPVASHGPAQVSEALVLGSVIAAVAGVYLFGFLIAIPVYLIATITLIGRKPVRTAVLTALLTTASIYVAFELLLSYRLFGGVLFS